MLRDSLADLLSEPQEEALAEHLAGCPQCRAELEQLAGSSEDWSRIERALRQLDCDSALTRSEIPAGGSQDCEDDADLVADFAVDFLEPSREKNAIGKLGDIDIREIIGRGGMGLVLKGFQPELNRPVAVKVLAPHLATSGAARKRFAREAQATAVIVHPNVMPILTVNSSGKLPYLVMPYVACESLQQRLDREGGLPVVDILRIGLQVSKGLAAAHAQGLIHRDVKPANILLEKGVDRVMLTDFGLARAVDDASLTRSGIIAGTPQYMSPEQARGEAIDARSDQFSLGSVLYAMCTGRAPFRAETSYGILRRVTDSQPRPVREITAEIPDWLERLIGRLHAKEAAGRFENVDEVADILEDCLAHVQQPSVAPLPAMLQPPRGARWRDRIGRRFRTTCLAAALAVTATIAALFPQGEAPPEPRVLNNLPLTDFPATPNRQSSIVSDWDPAHAWSDDVETQLDQLRRAADDLAVRAEELWPSLSADSLTEPQP